MTNLITSIAYAALAMLFCMGTATLEMNYGAFSVPAWASAWCALVFMGASIYYMNKAGQS